jgi:Flp pilus assembly protein TadG
MRSLPHFRQRRRRGANAIEFALTLPFFLLITFGMMEYGWYFSNVAQVNGAVAQSCRLGSLLDPAEGNCGDACLIDAAVDNLTTRLSASALSCNDCSAVITGTAPNRFLECTADVQYNAITGYFPSTAATPTEIKAFTRVRLEWQRVSFP